MSGGASVELETLLEEGRRREKARTLFYRVLAVEAGAADDAPAEERLNELHADEQHHLSRLTARLLEMGLHPRALERMAPPEAPWPRWEDAAREGEVEEVRWYEAAVEAVDDPETRALLEEILESERHHAAELRGKWMSA